MSIEKKINRDRRKLIKLLKNIQFDLEQIRFKKDKRGNYILIIDLGGK